MRNRYRLTVLFLFLGTLSAYAKPYTITPKDATPLDIVRGQGCITVEELLNANDIVDARHMPGPGSMIDIPFVRPEEYDRVVQERDQLAGTAKRLGGEVAAHEQTITERDRVIAGLREEIAKAQDDRSSLSKYRALFIVVLVVLIIIALLGFLFYAPFRRIADTSAKLLEERRTLEAELARRKTQFTAELKQAVALLGVEDAELAQVADLVHEISGLKSHEARNVITTWVRNHQRPAAPVAAEAEEPSVPRLAAVPSA